MLLADKNHVNVKIAHVVARSYVLQPSLRILWSNLASVETKICLPKNKFIIYQVKMYTFFKKAQKMVKFQIKITLYFSTPRV